MDSATARGMTRWMYALLACLLLAGCVTTGNNTRFDPQTGPWSGRLALRVESDPPQSYSVAFELSGDANQGELRLISPLGNTVAELNWQPAGAVLVQNGSEQHYESAGQMIEQTTGAAIPLQALFAWLRGEQASVEGWQADLTRWSEGRLAARRQSPPPEAELRLILDR